MNSIQLNNFQICNAFSTELFSNLQILKFKNVPSHPMTIEQLKEIKERVEALRRYL